ncbi:MAG TPA: PilZ domain-containing protein [Allosphingosinicella sp.]|nr:PilZ domain-containing protein [Allosphingosinicella sp.]
MAYSSSISFPASANERALERERVDYHGTVRELGSIPRQVRVVDLTRKGCRLAGGDVRRSDEVWIRVGQLPPIRGKVVWVAKGEFGCEFYKPLAPSELRSIAAGNQAPRPVFVSPAAVRRRA